MKHIIRMLLIPFYIIIFTLFIFFHSNHNIYSEPITYFENFNDGIANGWSVALLQDCPSSNWVIENGMYGFKVNSNDPIDGCKTNTILLSQEIPVDASYIYEFDMKFSESISMDRNFLIKYVDPNKWYGIHIVDTTIYFEKVYSDQEYSNPFPDKYYNFIPNYIHHFKISVFEDSITVEIDGGKFFYEYKDLAPILQNKYVGLRAGTGYLLSSEVWFDNISLTIFPKIKGFNLPFEYLNRIKPTKIQFQNAFWKRMTALFDHNKEGNKFLPFTSNSYNKKDCPSGKLGITCYDAHNGTDFSPLSKGGQDVVYPTADGIIVYRTPIKNKKCVPDKSGFGCLVIIYHPEFDIYTLYAHLSEIFINIGNSVKFTDTIAKMGNTGCGPKCGVHLHLGVLKNKSVNNSKEDITPSDWEEIVSQIEPLTNNSIAIPKHYCSYKAPNGNILSFQDPSGWNNNIIEDPWSLSLNTGNCATESPYLWLFDIGITKPATLDSNIWFHEELY